MLVDTNVFIDFLNGNEQAKMFLEAHAPLFTSLLVIMEVIIGLPKKQGIKEFQTFLSSADITVVPVNEEISRTGYELFVAHYHATHVGIADTLIAATSIVLNQPVATLNLKHYKNLPGVRVVKPYQ